MKFMMLIHFGLFLHLIPASSALEVGDVVRRLQKSYESVQTVQAQFHQTYHSRRFGEQRASGDVTIAKPGKMRWDYEDPKGKVLLMDGEKVYLFDPEDRQLLIGRQPREDDLPVALSFLWGKGRLAELFQISIETQTDQSVVLKCVPKEPIPNTAEVYLTLQLDELVLVKASRIRDGFGGENEIRFENLRVNRHVPKSIFSFTPPEGTPIVNLDMSDLKL